jgi:hypothetical protein
MKPQVRPCGTAEGGTTAHLVFQAATLAGSLSTTLWHPWPLALTTDLIMVSISMPGSGLLGMYPSKGLGERPRVCNMAAWPVGSTSISGGC